MSQMIDIATLRKAFVEAVTVRKHKLFDLEHEADAKGMFLLHTKEVIDLRREIVALGEVWAILKKVSGDA